MEIARARFADVTGLRQDLSDLSGRLEARKLVDRAKSVLQARFGWDEPTAFAWLQRAAMDGRVPMAEVARGVLERQGGEPGAGTG
jgi:two-component system, response regulator PdtaR